MDGKLIVLAVVVGVVAVGILVARQNGRSYRPLARHRPKYQAPAKPLGMEATDIESVRGILQRNAAIDRVTGWGGGLSAATAEVPPAPFPDDETYAARYLGTHKERK